MGLAPGLAPPPLDASTSTILAWNVGCLCFVGATLPSFFDRNAPSMRGVAAGQDEGQGIVPGLVIALSAASLGVVGVELSLAEQAGGLDDALRVAPAFSTVAASWFVALLIVALHYAREVLAPDDGDPDTQQEGGPTFPSDRTPDCRYLVPFAAVIGVADQTAAVSFASRASAPSAPLTASWPSRSTRSSWRWPSTYWPVCSDRFPLPT